MVPIRPIVDGGTGEIAVKIHNDTDRVLPGARLSLRDRGSASAPLFAFTPSREDGGYDLARIPLGGIQRSFCLRPVHAEIGRSYDIDIVLEPNAAGTSATRRNIRAQSASEAPRVLTAHYTVEVEARPEIYAAIGAIETLRDGLLKRYQSLIQKGRDTQRGLETMLPGSPSPDAVRVALDRQSFDFLRQALDLGLRVVQAPARRTPSRSKSGDDSDGAPPS